MNEHERDQVQADALDRYLSRLQARDTASRPGELPAEQASFAASLVDLAKASTPDAAFAARLETQLSATARERVAKAHPRPEAVGQRWNATAHRGALQGTVSAAFARIKERMSNVNRRLVYAMGGAVVLALILFAALALFDQTQPAVGPDQVAQLPTSTPISSPTAPPTNTVLPTNTPLPPTAGPSATKETPLPAATPTAMPTRAIVSPTAIPTATPTPRAPISLPALAKWQETGVGGGGGGGPVALNTSLVLGIELPQGPAQMIVYVQREPEKVSAAYAAQMAERLGLQGEVYQSIKLASVPNPEDEPFRGYLAVDGAHWVMFEATGIARYTDRNRIPYVEGHWREPESVPPLAEAVKVAEAFLRAAGLLEGEFLMTAGGDMLSFYRVLDGQWPVLEPFVQVSMWSDGQIGQVVVYPQTLDLLAEYPIISAQEAWEILSSSQAVDGTASDQRVWQNPYRSPETPVWGEWQRDQRHQNPAFWARSYQAGQKAHRFGVPQTWFSLEDGGMPYITIGNLVLTGDLVMTGDVQSLADYALQQYVREQWNYVHVWGEVQDAGDHQALAVEGWEPAEESYWYGTLSRQGEQDLLIMDGGSTILLPDLPAGLADGTPVSVSGGQVADRLEWHVIQEMDTAEPQPEATLAQRHLTIEQVDLVYLALQPNVIPPERFSDLGYRAVQPAWRFRGHDDRGAAFERYVQAVASSFILP